MQDLNLFKLETHVSSTTGRYIWWCCDITGET